MKRIIPLSFASILGWTGSGCDLDPAEVGAFDRQGADADDPAPTTPPQPEPGPDDGSESDAPDPDDDTPPPPPPPPELEPVPDGGAVIDELLETCTVNTLLFSFDDGSGTTGPGIVDRARSIEGDSLVFESATLGGVGGRPFIFGVLTLTLDGRDPATGELVISGSIVNEESTLSMEPLRVDLTSLPDFYEVILQAPFEDVDRAFDLVTTAPASFIGSVGGEPFEYDLRWYLGYDSFSGVGFAACDSKVDF